MDLAAHITQITNPLLQLANAKGGDELLRATLRQVLADAAPRQAEVLRRCAVPHFFDTDVLAVLRRSDEGNERVLELLQGYSFVRQLARGRFAYHEQVRKELLAEWAAARPGELRDLHLALYDYYTRLLKTTDGIRLTQPTPSYVPGIKSVPMDNWDLWRREALYHLLSADPARGIAQIETAVDEMLSASRIADAEALVRIADAANLEGRWGLTVRYMRAQLDEAALRLDSAAEQFATLLMEPGLDEPLRARVRQSLGEVYSETGQWARAIALFRQSLAFYQAQGDARPAADAQLQLGEAYLNLGLNTGGWYVPAVQISPVRRAIEQIWAWVMGLPFLLIAWAGRPFGLLLPLPHYCAHYQNWLLIRLYRTAHEWYERARASYAALGDGAGTLRAEQQVARIAVLFGREREAIARIEALLKNPLTDDPYRLAWLERSLAEAKIAAKDPATARALLDNALAVFRELGDVRREAAVLALQGRAAAKAGDGKGALESYKSSLDRFRALRYTAARELILSDLRVWNRTLPQGDALREQIIALIDAEPEKRYVARFPRSLLPLLQFASLLTLPLALLLLAVVAPTVSVQAPAVLQPLSLRTFYDPLRALGALAVLVPLVMGSYAWLGMLIIALLPIGQIDNEQPDYFITNADGITRYDERGRPQFQMLWRDARRWLGLDRRIWSRPLPLYSRSFLENERGDDLRIDGITGWYTTLQRDIGRRLAQAGSPVQRSDLGYTLLRSKSGLAFILGFVLLLIHIAAENGALRLLEVIGPQAYTIFGLVATSGVLILWPAAYWLARRPLLLSRELELDERLPYVIAGVGLVPIIAFLVSGGKALPIAALNYSLLVWGAYMVAEAAVTLLIPRHALLRRVAVGLVVLATFLATALPFGRVVVNAYSGAATRLAGIAATDPNDSISPSAFPTALEAGQIAAAATATDPLSLLNLGSAQYYDAQEWREGGNGTGRYADAIATYTRAIAAAPANSPLQALLYYNRALAYRGWGDQERTLRDSGRAQEICGLAPNADDPNCVNIRQQLQHLAQQ